VSACGAGSLGDSREEALSERRLSDALDREAEAEDDLDAPGFGLSKIRGARGFPRRGVGPAWSSSATRKRPDVVAGKGGASATSAIPLVSAHVVQ